MKVFIVIEYMPHEGGIIRQVFSNNELASKYIKDNPTDGYVFLEIEEYEIRSFIEGSLIPNYKIIE